MNDDAPEMPCPRCGGACARIAPDLWECDDCGGIWTGRNIMENDEDFARDFVFVHGQDVCVFRVLNLQVCECGATWEVVTPCEDYLEVQVLAVPPCPFVGRAACAYLSVARRCATARLWAWAGERGRGGALSAVRCESL